MTTNNLPDPVIVARRTSLSRLVDEVRHEKILAVDTESNSLYAYRERVCLIQFSTSQRDYLVDVLALDDLSPLRPLFADAGMEKVFHAAEYDLLCLHRDFGFEFANLFDTMIAARILGREAVGLGSMLETEFGVYLDKRYQRANWGQRPLPAQLLDYARLDTRYLIPLRNRLREQLGEQGLLPLAEEDFQRLISANNHRDEPANGRGVDCWRVSGAHDLLPQQAAVLQELCQYRDQVARHINRPLFKVINDRTLLEIAVRLPKNAGELRQLPGMSPAQMRRHAANLLQAVDSGLQAKPIYPPRTPRPDDGFLERLDALRQWRKRIAKEMGVKSDVILPRDLLFTLAEEGPADAKELAAVLHDSPWRLEHFGHQILAILAERAN